MNNIYMKSDDMINSDNLDDNITDDEIYQYTESSNKSNQDLQEKQDKFIPLAKIYCKRIYVDESKIINLNDQNKIDKFKDYVEGELLLNLLPAEIYISTMTATCKINNFKFNCENIAKYIDLSYDGIEDIICAFEEKRRHNVGEKNIIYRTLPPKKENKRKKKNKDVFYNQVSIHLNIKTKHTDPVHVKLFRNGSVHITGCQSAIDVVETMTSILSKLKADKFIIDKVTKKIVEKPFVSEKNCLDVSFVNNLKINMINTNFKIPFKVNLTELYELMVLKGIECRYDKINHSCVNVKYNHPEKKISIFVFEKGSIVITGAKNGEHIRLAYDFINKFLYSNYKQVVKKDINLLKLK
jgi:TATA-box binding protein (TBP) (component of TFIID and TFIIIB)